MPRGDLPLPAEEIVDRLKKMQSAIQSAVRARRSGPDSAIMRRSDADTIYGIDVVAEPIVEAFCRDWSRSMPLVLVAEGLIDDEGREGPKVFPEGATEADAAIRLIVDPIDGTRELMYDKRSAWSLAGVAPNRGPQTGLRDIEVAVMTELPTTKLGWADVLWAVRGQGVQAQRVDLATGESTPFIPRPSSATGLDHGFATVSSFFPGTKRPAAELVERIASELLPRDDVTCGTMFDDQYISTGGQWYELIVGHDRFNADLRPAFYRLQGIAEGMCCHPYDCCCLLIAEEAGVILTDERGRPLDAPLDTTTGIDWLGYANADLRARIEPVVKRFLAMPEA